MWEVRFARFDGDLASRAEEWRIAIENGGKVRSIVHTLPESRAGASLTRGEAHDVAVRALEREFGVEASTLVPVAADEEQRPARVDWSFVWGDPKADVGKGAEARYAIAIAGDQLAAAGRFIHLPEGWLREERARHNRLQIVELGALAVFAAAGLMALVVGVRSWVKRRVDSQALAIVAGWTFVQVALVAANAWPRFAMGLSTTDPVVSQVTLKVLGTLSGGLVAALLAGFCAGVGSFGARNQPRQAGLAGSRAIVASIAAGALVAGVEAVLAPLVSGTPLWPSSGWRANDSPWLGAALGGTSIVVVASIALFVVHAAALLTRNWTRRVWLAVAIVIALECAFALAKGRSVPAASLVAGLAAGVTASLVVLLLLRHDLRLIPAFVAASVLLNGFAAASRSGELAKFALDAVVTVAVAWMMTIWLARPQQAMHASPTPG